LSKTIDPEPQVDDDQLVTWWGLVIEGYHVTSERLAAEIERQFGLSMPSFDILIRLVRSPGNRMRMTMLAKEAALSSGGFTKVADRLTKAGLIHREPSETDRRVTYAVLTDHGLDVATRARAVCADLLRERVLAPLGQQNSANLAQAMRTLRTHNGSEND
jgi:DNA-binding MarR family transcriptional regulator